MAKAKNTQIEKPRIEWSREKRIFVTALLFILGIYAIYFSYTATYLGYISQWIVAILSMVIVGVLIRDANSLNGSYGLWLLSTTKGIDLIDGMSKRNNSFWNAMSIWGLTLGFGLLTYPFLRGKLSKKMLVFGMLCILFILFFVYPLFITGFQFIRISQLQTALQSAGQTSSSTGTPYLTYLLYGIAIVTGLVGFIFVALLINAAETLFKIVSFFQTVVAGAPQSSALGGIIPGVAPLIPGVTIPLLAGIVAIILMLVPHEISHGVLARMAKVRLKAVGLVFMGIIPVGAFVEPDEKQVAKLDDVRQTRILAAGTSANFIMMFLLFALLFITITYVMPSFYANKVVIAGTVQGEPAYGILKPGMQILQWNGVPVNNITSAEAGAALDKPGSLVTIVTNNGTYTLGAISINGSTKGYIGILINQEYVPVSSAFAPQMVAFFYSLFALSLLLSFSLAVLNLLPLPLFDGWRLFKVNVKNQNITRVIAGAVCVLIFLNLVGWAFIPFAG